MTSNKADHIVVWEKYVNNEWYAYPPNDSNQIEETFSEKNLGLSKMSMKCKMNVDFERFVEITSQGNTPLRRAIYLPKSAAFNGIQWTWDDNISWQTYSQIIIEYIECAYNFNNKGIINLNLLLNNFNYSIDFHRMKQINISTGFERNVRRIIQTKSYTSYLTKPTFVPQNFTFISLLPSDVQNFISNSSALTNEFLFTGQNTGAFNLSFGSSSLPNDVQTQKRSQSQVNSKDKDKDAKNFNFKNLWQSIPKINFQSNILSVKKKTKYDILKFHYVEQLNLDSINGLTAEDALELYYQVTNNIKKDEDCLICCDSLKSNSTYNCENENNFNGYYDTNADANDNSDCDVIQFTKCQHLFHKQCIFAMYNSGPKTGCLRCPSCKQMYGLIIGNCPDGTMKWWIDSTIKLPSFESCETIIIDYNIKRPTKKSIERNNGVSYSIHGFPRTAFLPNNKDGLLVLDLLSIAWQRRLTFTVGTSITTGHTNCVVWNEIHHKTHPTDTMGHGYPDPKYFDNVLEELAAQGVTPDDIQ